MRARINYGIEVCTELRGIDPGGFCCSIYDGRARHEATSLNGSQLSDRRAVPAHDDRSSSLRLTEHCGGLIAKLSLSDGTDFHKTKGQNTNPAVTLRGQLKLLLTTLGKVDTDL